jgi:uncharacterized membrane protein
MPNPLVGVLPAAIRQRIYVIYAVLGFLLGGVQVGWSAAGGGQPTWLTVVLAVFAFVGSALGVTAASNMQAAATSSPVPPATAGATVSRDDPVGA